MTWVKPLPGGLWPYSQCRNANQTTQGHLVGIGLLVLFRHKASLGGINVLALYLQDQHGLRAGAVQMALDCAIVVAAFAVVAPRLIAISIIGAVALNLVVAVNHKPGRYLGV